MTQSIVNKVHSPVTLMGEDADGNSESVKSTNNAAHSLDQAQLLTQGLVDSTGAAKTTATTAYPRYANDVNAYALHTTGGAVVAADLAERSWTEGDVDGCVINCWGGTNFKGVYVTLAATDIGTAQAALRLQSTNDNGDRNRYWIPADKSVFIPFPSLAYIWIIAIDTDASEDNNVEIVPV